MNSFDIWLYHIINHWAGHYPILDPIMAFTARYALEIYALLFIAAWFTLPKSDEKKRHGLIVMGISGVLALLINFAIGYFYFRPRPFVALPKGSFTQLIPHAIDSSFPSDHTAGSFGFAAGSWRRSQQWVRRSFTLLAFFVGFSRIYAGVHWPTDVLAGMIIGILSARIVWALNSCLKPLTLLGLRLFHLGRFATQ